MPAAQVIEIPGVGNVEFPASMSEADVSAASKKLYEQGPSTVSGPSAAPQATPSGGGMADYAQMAKDALGGVRAGVASTVFGGGDLIRRGLGMERVIETPEVKALTTPPESTAGRVGYGAEQIGEFMIPVAGMAGKAWKVKAAIEAARAAALTEAHGGTTGEAAASAVLGGIPAEKIVSGAGKILGRSAEKSVVQAITGGGGKEAIKQEAARIAPQILERGISGSRPAMLEQAKEATAAVGKKLTAAYEDAAAAGQTVKGDVIRGNIQLARDALTVHGAEAGQHFIIPGTEQVVSKLDAMDRWIEKLGPDIPVDKAAQIKRVWDRVVARAGLYGPKAQASATDSAHAWALREGATSFRDLLNTNPTVAALNAEFKFQKGLADVIGATEKRLQGHGSGLMTGLGGLTGAGIGAGSGDTYSERTINAIVGGIAGRSVLKALQSPTYRTAVLAPVKKNLADALASGHAGRIAGAFRAAAASLPANLQEEE